MSGYLMRAELRSLPMPCHHCDKNSWRAEDRTWSDLAERGCSSRSRSWRYCWCTSRASSPTSELFPFPPPRCEMRQVLVPIGPRQPVGAIRSKAALSYPARPCRWYHGNHERQPSGNRLVAGSNPARGASKVSNFAESRRLSRAAF
jgi:hypothetical protein